MSKNRDTPKALVDFMMSKWKAGPAKPPPPIENAHLFRERRPALSKLFPGETLLIPSGHEQRRANDTVYRFRPGSDFYYLTGNVEPDCVLALVPKKGGGHRHILYVEPNPGHSDATFFTDRAKGQLWVGPRLGVKESQARFGVHEGRPLPELKSLLTSLRRKSRPKWRLIRGLAPKLDSRLARRGSKKDRELGTALSELRLVKDAFELRELSAAIASTKQAIEEVIAELPRAASERDVECTFNRRARTAGNDVGYNTIAACGANACILHWGRNDGPVTQGQLFLLDAGIERDTLYTADITRTLPVNGRFTKEQRELYSLVIEAQAAAFKAIRPGAGFLDPHWAAMKVLAEGLERLGILPFTVKESLKKKHQYYRRYTLHGTSHMLGLDVHDCAQLKPNSYRKGKLREGMVLTVEPGLYFQTDDLTVPARYRGIGIRVEDDVVVTAKGYRNLSLAIPRTADDVEAWMSTVWKGSN